MSASAEVKNCSLRLCTANLEGLVAPERGGDVVEIRGGPAVELGYAIGVGEDQVLGDLAHFGIVGESPDPALMLARRDREGRGVEQRLRHEFGDMAGEQRIFDAADEAFAHDHVRAQILHHDHRQIAVEMVDLGHQLRRVPGLLGQRHMLKIGA